MKPAGYIMWQLNNAKVITTILGRICYIDQGEGWEKWDGGNVTFGYIRRNFKKVGNLTQEDLMLELL